MKLANKVIIVTGGSGLIGSQIINFLVLEGAHVINADLNVESDLSNGTFKCNITDPKSIESMVGSVNNHFGKIHGVVNNAYPRTSDWGKKFEEIPYESWKLNVDMQLNSVFNLCQQALKYMKIQEFGSIVNIASIYGVVGNDFTIYEEYEGTSPAAYSAIKGGLINFTRYLASYYGKYHIRVNCVSPGGVLDSKNQHPSFIQKYSDKSPLKRLANPEEIAPAVAFLLSDYSSYITGHNLMVDGGWTAI